MPNTYNYINTAGNMQQFQADTPEAALSGAPNIDPKSGVQLVSPQTTGGTVPAIMTTGPQWNNYNAATNSLNSFVNTSDPYMALFAEQRKANELAAENAIASATATKEREAVKTEQERNALIAGLNTAAEKTGLAPNSAYQLQVIEGAQNQFNTRFALIDREEKLAIARAKAAQAVGDTAVLKEQLDYAVKLRKEKADALEAAQKLEWEKYKFNNMTPYQKALLEMQRIKDVTAQEKAKKDLEEETQSIVYNKEWLKDKFTSSELFNMIPKLFTEKDNPRVRDLSRKREIESVLDRLQVQINAYKAAGIDDADIQAYLDSLVED